MNLEELYQAIGGDYEQALKVLRVEKLVNKHICKLPNNGIFEALAKAGQSMDGEGIFENAHAIKGVCSNLGLTNMARIASDLSEEFRPENDRKMTDDQVREKVDELSGIFHKACEEIHKYESA